MFFDPFSPPSPSPPPPILPLSPSSSFFFPPSPSSVPPLHVDFSVRVNVLPLSFTPPTHNHFDYSSSSSYPITTPSKPAQPSHRPSLERSNSDPYYRPAAPPPPYHQQNNGLLLSPQTPEQHLHDRLHPPSTPALGTYRLVAPDQTPPAATPKRRTSTPKLQKSFQCVGYGACAMTFTRSEHLARHVRKHTGEKPFVCHCTKSFSRIDNLRQHCATVHSESLGRNEETIKALLPVHDTLSQQAGRDHLLSKKGQIVYTSSPPAPNTRRVSNKLAPIGECEMMSPEIDVAHLSSPGNGRLLSAGGRYGIPQLEPRGGSDGVRQQQGGGGGQAWSAGLRMTWNGEDDNPPDGLGLVKREFRETSSSVSAWPEEGRHHRSDLESEEDDDEERAQVYHRRGSDSNVVFGSSWAAPPPHLPLTSTTTSSSSNHGNHHIPPPLTFHRSSSNFSPRSLHPNSEVSQFGSSSSLSGSSHFPSSSTNSVHFPSSSASTHASSSALAPAFGLSPLLDADSRPGSRPSSRGASLDLSYPLPWGGASTSSYQLHQHPSFNHSSNLPSHLSHSVVSGTVEHQTTYRSHSITGPSGLHPHDEDDASRRQEYGREVAISGYHSRQDQIHENGGLVHAGEGPLGASLNGNGNGNGVVSRPPSPPSMLWGLPQLSPRKHRLASLSQQGGGEGGQIDSSPESRSSSGGWGGDSSSVYSGGRQDPPKSIQRRQSLPYAHSYSDHHQSSSSYSFGDQHHHRSSPHQYHTHPQHPGLPSYHSDTFVPQLDGQHHLHHNQQQQHHHEQHQQNQQQHHAPPPPAHVRAFSSTPVHCVSLPTKHSAIPDSSPFSYHAPSHEIHQRHAGRGGADIFARPLPLESPPLHVGALSPLTYAPELPPPHHDELPAEPASGSLLLGPGGGGGGPPTHLRSDSHRSPSPTNLEVHLSLASPFEQDKRSRIYSGPNVTTSYAPLPTTHYHHPQPQPQLASLPLTSEGSGQSSTSNNTSSSLDSVNFTRRKSLALSVSDLMGPSVDQMSGSRPSTSTGVMGSIGEGEEEGNGRFGGGAGARPATAGATSYVRACSQ